MDHDTGKNRKLNDDDMMQMQTLASEILSMERGQSKTETGKEHLERNDFIIEKQRVELERKNEDLRDEIAIRDETIEQLQSNIKQMEVEHQKLIQEVKQSYEAEHRKQSEYIDKILSYFPYVEKLMPMNKYLSEKMGFNDNLIKALCTFKEILVKGKLYSTMFNRSF